MADDSDYVALWSIARDALDAVNDLTSAMLSPPRTVPVNPRAMHNPPPDAYEKWEAERERFREQQAKAVDAIRNAGKKLVKLLAEDRFVAPVAGVWPPSAPEIARRLSGGLGMAASAAHAARALKGDVHIDQPKRYAVDAEYTLRAVIAELERRTDVAEVAHQRQVEKLRAEHPDWSGAEIAVKVASASNRSPTPTDQGGTGNASSTTPPAAKPEQSERAGRSEADQEPAAHPALGAADAEKTAANGTSMEALPLPAPRNTTAEKPSKEWWKNGPPEPGSKFSTNPIEAPLYQLAKGMGYDERVVKVNNGTSGWWIQKIHRCKYRVWFDSSRVAEKVQESIEAQTASNRAKKRQSASKNKR